ncbi:MAG: hypothetical protein ABI528_07455 [bacterium]
MIADINFEKIKKAAGVMAALFIFAIAFIIILNTVKSSDGSGVSSENLLSHLINDHKVNETHFSFIKIDFAITDYIDVQSNMEVNIAAAIGLFLIPSTVIFYNSQKRKLYYAEKFSFVSGFKDFIFRPPKNYC